MENNKTIWRQSVAGVLIKEGKVLLTRHTYGVGKGKLIIPGGYLNEGETVEEALRREFFEETSLEISIKELIAIRFNLHDWYVVFKVKYEGGKEKSDNSENSEVLWIDTVEALNRDDVPDLTKQLIKSALSKNSGMVEKEYQGNPKLGKGYLYSIDSDK